MCKLTRYNQKLLAIIGTSILIVGLISLLGATYSLISPLFRSNDSIEEGVDIISSADSTESLQLLSMGKLIPLDTSKSNYVLPVGQIRTKEVLGMAMFDNNRYKSKSFELRNFNSGLNNNFVYIDYRKDIKQIVFDRKLAIIYWSYFRDGISELLLFKVIGDDTNKDGTLNGRDRSNLYVFDINSLKLLSFDIGNKSIMEFFPIKGTNIIGIETIEENIKVQNNNIDDVIGFDTKTFKLVPIIPKSMKDELQDILDEKSK